MQTFVEGLPDTALWLKSEGNRGCGFKSQFCPICIFVSTVFITRLQLSGTSNEILLREKNPLPHQGIKPTSVFHLAFQSDTQPTELPPTHPKRKLVAKALTGLSSASSSSSFMNRRRQSSRLNSDWFCRSQTTQTHIASWFCKSQTTQKKHNLSWFCHSPAKTLTR